MTTVLTLDQINHLWDTRVGLPNDKYPLTDNDKEQFARAIEAAVLASPEVQAQQWQPIDTAPTDGTWVLAVNAHKNPSRQHVVHYSERHGKHYPWVTDGGFMSFVAGVTHWTPLPAPPK